MLLLAALALSSCAGTQHTEAPPPHAVTGVVRGALSDPVVDPVHHLVYGLGDGSVSVLNEATGRIRILARLGRRHYPYLLALDPSADRVLVEVVRLDRLFGPKGRQDGVFTALADDIDARTGRLIASVPMSTFPLYAYILEQGSVAIDQALHHGFVTDHAGRAVMIDTRTGRVLARFHPGVADSENALLAPVDPAVVDERSHRLFIATVGMGSQNARTGMAVIETHTGRVLRRLSLGLAYTKAFFFDPVNRRIVASGPGLATIVDVSPGIHLRVAHPPILFDLFGIDPRLHRIFLFGGPVGLHLARYLVWLDELSGKVHIGLRYDTFSDNRDAPATGIIDSSAGRLFVVPEDGTVGIFSTSTGHLLKRLPLVPEARPLQTLWGMAVDEGTRRLILGGSGGALLVDTHAPYTH